MSTSSMRGPYSASFALHATVAAALVAGAALTATVVTHQEQAFLEKVAKQEEADKKQAEKESATAVTEAAKTQVALSLTDLVAGHVAPPDSDMIIADAQQAVEDLFAQQAGGADGSEDPQLIAEAEHRALERALASANQRLQQALVAQVRDHIRREVVPEITERVDRELKQGLGETLKQKVEQAVRDDKRERLTAVAKQVRDEVQALKDAGSKDDVRQLREGAAAAEERLREPLAKAVSQDPLLDGKAKAAAADTALAERLAQTADDKDKAKKTVDERVRGLEQLAQALEQHAGRSEEDAVQQRIAAKAQEKLTDPLAKAVRERVESQAVPVAAEKITESVAKDLEKLGLPKDEFLKAVTGDIKTALHEELPADDASTAWMKTARAMNFRPSADLAETRAAVDNAADALDKAAQDQQDAKLDDARAQRARATRMSELTSIARKALGDARDASLSADDKIEQGLNQLRKSHADTDALRAAEAMDKRLDDPAKQAAAEAVKDLRESAQRMRAVGEALAREAAAKPTPPEASVRELVGQQDAHGAEGSAQAVAAKVGEGLDDAARQAVDKAASQLKGDGVLTKDERVSQLLALRQNLADALQRSSDPRAMGASQLAAGFGAGLTGGGRGAGAGAPTRLRGGFGLWNRELYEKFVKDLRERTNPSSAQAAPTAPAGLDTEAAPATVAEPAVVYVPETSAAKDAKEAKAADKPAAVREPLKPTFTSPASGYAVFQEKPLTIDGDLADWGERKFPIRMQWNADNTEFDGGPELWLRWSNEGMYIAYAVQDPTGIQKCDNPWSGDCIEMWLDTENTRKEFMSQAPSSQQFVFMPFGCEKSPGTFCEIGRGARGLGSHQQYFDVDGKRGFAAAKQVEGGYVVEAFMRKQALASPVLLPGMWVAVNFSMNTGLQGRSGREMQWSASKGISTWDRPNTWGDILLLGSDATVKVLSRPVEGEPAPIDHLVAGQSFTVEIADADLNIDIDRADRVACTVEVPGRDEPTLAVLKETGPNTGVFRGSLATRSREDDPAPNAVRVRPGEVIRVTYQDVRGGYGETDRVVTAELPVAIPVMSFGGK